MDDAIRGLSRYEFEKKVLTFSVSFRISAEAVCSSKGLMHFPLDRNASGPELIFEKLLDRPDNNVLLWYKNADHGANAFCIPYTTRHQVRGKTIEFLVPTCPDFIVLFKDESIGIYELKDYDKKDDNDVAKALAISEMINQLCRNGDVVRSGLIYVDQQAQVVRDIEKYPEIG